MPFASNWKHIPNALFAEIGAILFSIIVKLGLNLTLCKLLVCKVLNYCYDMCLYYCDTYK